MKISTTKHFRNSPAPRALGFVGTTPFINYSCVTYAFLRQTVMLWQRGAKIFILGFFLNGFQPPGSDLAAFLPPGIGVSKVNLMEIFYSLPGVQGAHSMAGEKAPAHRCLQGKVHCGFQSWRHTFSLQNCQGQRATVMLEGFLSPALWKPFGGSLAPCYQQLCSAVPCHQQSSSHVFLHFQVANTVNRAGQKGFTGYQSSACGSLRTP